MNSLKKILRDAHIIVRSSIFKKNRNKNTGYELPIIIYKYLFAINSNQIKKNPPSYFLFTKVIHPPTQ